MDGNWVTFNVTCKKRGKMSKLYFLNVSTVEYHLHCLKYRGERHYCGCTLIQNNLYQTCFSLRFCQPVQFTNTILDKKILKTEQTWKFTKQVIQRNLIHQFDKRFRARIASPKKSSSVNQNRDMIYILFIIVERFSCFLRNKVIIFTRLTRFHTIPVI